MAALDLMSPVVTLATAAELRRQEGEQGTPRDSLTGLYNRAYLDAALGQLLALRRRSQPNERPPLSMIMFDIDSFRLLNDRHGRQVGDAVLRAVATLIRQRFRASDIPARVGPDSFFVVLNGASTEDAAEAAAQIRRQVRELEHRQRAWRARGRLDLRWLRRAPRRRAARRALPIGGGRPGHCPLVRSRAPSSRCSEAVTSPRAGAPPGSG